MCSPRLRTTYCIWLASRRLSRREKSDSRHLSGPRSSTPVNDRRPPSPHSRIGPQSSPSPCFWVSAGLALLSAETVSDAAGLLKEELDAGGGSGFSFGDLLADRAGTRFALAATRDVAAARAMQNRLSGRWPLDDLFPPAADLPEGIQDAELTSKYGAVGGGPYQALVAEIERRLDRCAALR